MPIPTPFPTQGPEAAPTAPVPAIPVAPQAAQSLAEMIEQVISISTQLAGLKAQRSTLRRQIAGTSDPATRAALELRRAPLEGQISQLEINLASAKAQLDARRSGQQGYPTLPPSPGRSRGPDPDMVVGMSFVLAMCLVLPISIAIAKRIWRGKRDTGPIIEDRVSQRMDRLEQAVDTIAVEIERISEGQRFVTKVLAERPVAAVKPVPPSDANDAAGLNDAKPFLALGAGSIEPIRMAERQAVRQSSITPH